MLYVVVLAFVRPSAEALRQKKLRNSTIQVCSLCAILPATEGRILRVYGLVRPLPRLVQKSLAAYGALQWLLVVSEMNRDIVRLER